VIINAKGLYYRELNRIIRDKINEGETKFKLINVNGQRYIGDGLSGKLKIEICGIAGNDLGAFMNGPEITVFGNAQDAIANTMNAGAIYVFGHAGDALCYGMRGGKVFIRDDVGYRVGIHMKEYKEQRPLLIIGGKAGNFLGEYMAGGALIILGLNLNNTNTGIAGDYFASGMHGGVIYTRIPVEEQYLGKEVKMFNVDDADIKFLEKNVTEFLKTFKIKINEIDLDYKHFCKYIPISKRPYGKLYVNA